MAAEKKEVLTLKNIRNINMENILHSVLENRSVTRSALAKENGISLMTVKHIVDALIEAGILAEKESLCGDVGRKPKVLEISEKYGSIVCIDLTSKETFRFLIYDIYRDLKAEQSFFLDTEISYEEGLKEAAGKVKERLLELNGAVVGVAVFVPGAYDEIKDLVNYDLIAGFKELHIRALFEEQFSIKNILVFHDVFAAARSEYDSQDLKAESQFYFYCGYGVGGFFIYQDVPVSGAEKMAGEVGKMLLSMDGTSEGYRTLEDTVSVLAVTERMKEQKINGSFRDFLERYKRGEDQAVQLLEPVFSTISKVLYNLLWVYNPSRVVIDSCERVYCELITEHFRQFMEKMRDEAIPIHAKVSAARYDEYHRMQGCFRMARDAWIQEISDFVQ